MEKINYMDSIVLHTASIDKFYNQVKEEFLLLDDSSFSNILKISKERMIDIAQKMLSEQTISILLKDGWKNEDKNTKGCGVAIKIVLNNGYYEFTIYYGSAGEKFDYKKITEKTYCRVEEDSFNTICKFVIYNDDINKKKEEFKKLERTTLVLE